MGTRALIHIHDDGKDSSILTTIYRQFDGYPEGLGEDIKAVLGGKQVVNGYSDPDNQVNGMGCAAAMLVGSLKDGKCGNVYIKAAGSSGMWEEYVYTLYHSKGLVMMDAHEAGEQKPIYSGPLREFSVPADETE